MRRFVRDHSLSIATIGAFLVIWLVGQAWAGHRTFNDDRGPTARRLSASAST